MLERIPRKSFSIGRSSRGAIQYKALVYQITKLKQIHSVTDTSLAALQSEVMIRKSKLMQLGVTEQQLKISQSELEHLKIGSVSDLRQAAASVKSQNTQNQSVLAEMNPHWGLAGT